MDARLEIAVAGKHRRGDQIIFDDGILNCRMQRAGIADAGRAAVTDQIEAEFVQIRLQAGLVQIIADDARAGRERGLDGGIDREAFFNRFFREQAGGKHHARIRRVGATGDGRDEHGTVAHVAVQSRSLRVNRIGGGMFGGHFPFAGFAIRHGLLAAAAGVNFAAGGNMHGARQLFGLHAKTIFRDGLAERADEFIFELRQFNAILPFRAGDARPHGAEIEFDFLRVNNVTFLGNAPQACAW